MFNLRAIAALAVFASLAHADTLRLRDGSVIIGNYVGGSQTEIWFQRSPAGAEAFPLFAVESLRFGNLIGSSTPSLPAPSALKSTKVRYTVAKFVRRPFPQASQPEQRPPTLAALFSRSISARLSP
jgi:hypothetical protein